MVIHARVKRASRPPGSERRWLMLGSWVLGVTGMDAGLCRELERRWGGFCHRQPPGPVLSTIQLLRTGEQPFLDRAGFGELYRMEAVNDLTHRVVVSYHFGVARDSPAHDWRIVICDGADELTERIVDNAVRYVTAELAVEHRGFAVHAAGLLYRERAWLLAGPSNSGKTTAVALAAPAVSLGDDFVLVLPDGGGWQTPATPFDNAERAAARPPSGLFPVAGIWRLYPSTDRTRVEPEKPGRDVASLMGCLAFPWAMPEAADRLLDRAGRFVENCRFERLHFTLDADLWTVLDH